MASFARHASLRKTEQWQSLPHMQEQTMMRGLRGGLLLIMGALPLLAWGQEEASLSSRRDHSLNVNRNLPITCKSGDLERRPGRSMAEVFGHAWPMQPEPATAGAHTRARMIATQFRPGVMRGLPPQPGMVIAAVLVDGKGKALAVEPLCATDEGYDVVTRRLLMRAKYQPATVNGREVVSVAMVVSRYRNSIFLHDGE